LFLPVLGVEAVPGCRPRIGAQSTRATYAAVARHRHRHFPARQMRNIVLVPYLVPRPGDVQCLAPILKWSIPPGLLFLLFLILFCLSVCMCTCDSHDPPTPQTLLLPPKKVQEHPRAQGTGSVPVPVVHATNVLINVVSSRPVASKFGDQLCVWLKFEGFKEAENVADVGSLKFGRTRDAVLCDCADKVRSLHNHHHHHHHHHHHYHHRHRHTHVTLPV
jgi:hypothetical protein